jgi:hypothetical protein
VYQVAPAASFTLLIFCSTFFLFVCLFLWIISLLCIVSHVGFFLLPTMQVGGPIWAEPIHDPVFIDKLLQSLLPAPTPAASSAAPAAVVDASVASPSPLLPSISSATPTPTNVSLPVSPLIPVLPSVAALSRVVPLLPLAATPRLVALLASAHGELPDAPLYYTLDSLAATLHIVPPKAVMVKYAYWTLPLLPAIYY